MVRIARLVLPDIPHHITQRGNRRAPVFLDADDYQRYIDYARRYFSHYGLQPHAYCLLSNHVHFVATPRTELALAHSFRDTHTAYAVQFNRRTQQGGHLWQGRFFSCPLDAEHFWTAVRYVEQNPVRAHLVERAEDYPWSSAAAHCGLRADPLVETPWPDDPLLPVDWAQWLRGEDALGVLFLRQATLVGRPCGSARFISQVETQLQRSVTPQKRGPKAKLKKSDDAHNVA